MTFAITTEAARKLVRVKIVGMLLPPEIPAFYRAEHDAIAAMGCRLGDHVALIDLTECPLQMQDIVGAFQREMTSDTQARRVAMVTGSSLSRMQARRLLRRDAIAMFETMEEAEAWLFS